MSPPPEKPVSASPLLSHLKEARAQITRAQRVLLLGAGVFGLALVVGIVAIQLPWQEQRKRLSAQAQEETERAELLLAIQRQRSELSTLEKKLLLDGGLTALTSQVSRLAVDAGLRIESVTPEPEVLIDPYMKYQLEVIASCNLFNLLRFIHSLEGHEPQFSVDELEVGEFQAEVSPSIIPFDTTLSEPQAFQAPEVQRLRVLIGAISKPKAAT